MPKRTKKNTTAQPPTKRRSPRATNSNPEQQQQTPQQQEAASSSQNSTETSSRTSNQHVVTNQQTRDQTVGQVENGTGSLTEITSKLNDMIKLLTTSLANHQTTNPPMPTPPQDSRPNDDSAEVLSVASENPPVNPPTATREIANGNPQGSTATLLLSSTQTPAVSLPPVTARLREKIVNGEFVDFNALLPKAMFSGTQTPEVTKSFTVQLSPGNDDLLVRPSQTSKKISSFQSWMEAWNIYLAIIVDHDPSRAPALIAYQRIITSASNNHPLSAWLNYDIRFRTLAASNPSVRWDTRENELWLEFFTGTASAATRWPCAYCGATTHYPENCLFRSQPVPVSTFDQRPPNRPSNGPQQFNENGSNDQPAHQRPKRTCHAFNRSVCRRSACNFRHVCELCGASHSARFCPNRGNTAF